MVYVSNAQSFKYNNSTSRNGYIQLNTFQSVVNKKKLLIDLEYFDQCQSSNEVQCKTIKKVEMEYAIGFEFPEFFHFCGWYTGRVTKVFDKYKRIYTYNDNTKDIYAIE